MYRLALEIHDDIYSAMKKIRAVEDTSVELEIPERSVLLENILNLKLLKKESEKIQKSLNLITFDRLGQSLINMLEEEEGGFLHGGFVSKDLSYDEVKSSGSKEKFTPFAFVVGRLKGSLPKFRFSGSKRYYALTLVAILILGTLFLYTQRAHKAEVKIITESQPLTKSITVKVSKDVASNAETRILSGIGVETSITETSSTVATGERLVGEKAKGKAKIFNKTIAEQVFKKGQILIYSDNNKDYKYSLDSSVTVPARTDGPLPGDPITLGEIEVSITAMDIGTAYNIDSDKSLDVDGYKSSEFTSATSEKITGGKSSTVKVVADADLKKLSDLVLKTIQDEAQKSLETKLPSSQKFIAGSQKVTVATQNYSAKVGDQKDILELTETAAITGLAYLQDEMNLLLSKVSQNLIPSGFEISDKEREVNVEILGNTDNSILSPVQADLQVTLKSFVVPVIDVDKIKTSLAGKSIRDAEVVLGKLSSVRTYSIKIVPNLILFGKVPSNKNNISIQVVRE